MNGQVSFIDTEGKLNDAAVFICTHVCRVAPELLRSAVILPANKNLLHAPWFAREKGGGAMVIAHEIYFTLNWFRNDALPRSYGKGDLECTKRWLLLLSHEIGHLPQARIGGYSPLNIAAYVLWFGLNYLWYQLRRKAPFTEHMPLEIDADLGRKTLMNILQEASMPEHEHPLIVAIHENDLKLARDWVSKNGQLIKRCQEQAGSWPAYRPVISL